MRKNDFYVYTLAHPDGTVFYIGKGKNNRIDFHEGEARKGVQSRKCHVIRKIWASGGQVLKSKVSESLTEEKAFELERSLIREYGRATLTNQTDGGEGIGPPIKRIYPIYRVTLEFPQELWEEITQCTSNRTQWIIEACQRELARETNEK